MADKFFPVSFEQWEREEGEIGYDFIKRYPKQLRSCSYEFGSVDFALISYSRFFYKDVIYESAGQYLVVRESGSTDRIIVGKPVALLKENAAIATGGIVVIPPEEVTIRYIISGDGILSGEAVQIIEKGTNGTVIKIAEGSHGIFKKWSDGKTVLERQELSVEEDINLVAEFAKAWILQYKSEQGAIMGNTKQKVEDGQSSSPVIIQELITDTFWKFREWNDGEESFVRTDVAEKDLNVTALYDPYSNFDYRVYPDGTVDNDDYYGSIDEKFINRNFQCVLGDSVTVEAMPKEGYAFDHWSDGLETAKRTDLAVNQAAYTFFAYFIKLFSFLYKTQRPGTLIGNTNQILKRGSNGTEVTATDDGFFLFKQWSDGILVPSRTDLNAQNDMTVTAEYQETGLRGYSANDGGTLEGWDRAPNSLKVMFAGESTTVTAVANEGYRFDQWDDGKTTARRTDEVVLSDVTEFIADFIKTWKLQYLIDTEQGSLTGELTQVIDDGSDGSSVSVSSKELWRFREWSDGKTEKTHQEIAVSKDTNITALFDAAAKIVFERGTNGAFGSSNTYSYAVPSVKLGTSLSNYTDMSRYTIIANEGYRFKQWSDGSTQNPYPMVPTEQKIYTLVAEYIKTWKLQYYAGEGGTLTGEAIQTVDQGANGSEVTIKTKAYYKFKQWSDGITTASRIDKKVSKDISVLAEYTPYAMYKYKQKLIDNINMGGCGFRIDTDHLGDCVLYIDLGKTGIDVYGVPFEGYGFDHWSDGITDNPRNDTPTEQKTYEIWPIFGKLFSVIYRANEPAVLTGNTNQTVLAGKNAEQIQVGIKSGYIQDLDLWNGSWSDNNTTLNRIDSNIQNDIDVTISFTPMAYYMISVGNGTNDCGTVELSFSRNPNSIHQIKHGNGKGGKTKFEDSLLMHLNVIPDTGYGFLKWSDGSYEETRDIPITEQKRYEYTAYFGKGYRIYFTVDNPEHGKIREGYNNPWGTEVVQFVESSSDSIKTMYSEGKNGYAFYKWTSEEKSLNYQYDSGWGQSGFMRNTKVTATFGKIYNIECNVSMDEVKAVEEFFGSYVTKKFSATISIPPQYSFITKDNGFVINKGCPLASSYQYEDGISGNNRRLHGSDGYNPLMGNGGSVTLGLYWYSSKQNDTIKIISGKFNFVASPDFKVGTIEIATTGGGHVEIGDVPYNPDENGTITILKPVGETFTITVVADDGYQFKEWEGNTSPSTSYEFTLNDEEVHHYTALFVKLYTVSVVYDKTKGTLQGPEVQTLASGERTEYISLEGKGDYAFYKYTSHKSSYSNDMYNPTVFSYAVTKDQVFEGTFGKKVSIPCETTMEDRYTSSTTDSSGYYWVSVNPTITIPKNWYVRSKDGWIINLDDDWLYTAITVDGVGKITCTDDAYKNYRMGSLNTDKFRSITSNTFTQGWTLESHIANNRVKITAMDLALVIPPDKEVGTVKLFVESGACLQIQASNEFLFTNEDGEVDFHALQGQELRFTAITNGYVFKRFIVTKSDNSVVEYTANIIFMKVGEVKSIRVVAKDEYTVLFSSQDENKGTISGTNLQSISRGSNASTVTVVEKDGFLFNRWLCNKSDIMKDYNMIYKSISVKNVVEDLEFTATFGKSITLNCPLDTPKTLNNITDSTYGDPGYYQSEYAFFMKFKIPENFSYITDEAGWSVHYASLWGNTNLLVFEDGNPYDRKLGFIQGSINGENCIKSSNGYVSIYGGIKSKNRGEVIKLLSANITFVAPPEVEFGKLTIEIGKTGRVDFEGVVYTDDFVIERPVGSTIIVKAIENPSTIIYQYHYWCTYDNGSCKILTYNEEYSHTIESGDHSIAADYG